MGSVIAIDSIMGAGKTTWIINLMKNNPNDKYIYVGVLLTELNRIKKSTPELNFKEPSSDKWGVTKKDDLHRLIVNGENIVTSHSLMKNFDLDIEEFLDDYTIILDEELEIAKSIKVKTGIRKELIENEKIIINEKGKVSWNEKKYNHVDTYNEDNRLKEIAKNNCLYYIDGGFFVWVMPPSIFKKSKKVYLLSYMIKESVIHGYLTENKISIEFVYPFTKEEEKIRKKAKDLIEIIDIPTFNKGNIGTLLSQPSSLSYNFFKKNRISISNKAKILTSIRNWLQKNNIKNDRVLFTTYKDFKHVGIKNGISGFGIRSYAKTWIYPKCRATNEYADKDVVIYCANIFPNSGVEKYLHHSSNFNISRKKYALSNALQFIYRSAIRKDKKIQIIIPSVAVKNLIIDWIDGKDI